MSKNSLGFRDIMSYWFAYGNKRDMLFKIVFLFTIIFSLDNYQELFTKILPVYVIIMTLRQMYILMCLNTQ
jgi:hypothetical protein